MNLRISGSGVFILFFCVSASVIVTSFAVTLDSCCPHSYGLINGSCSRRIPDETFPSEEPPKQTSSIRIRSEPFLCPPAYSLVLSSKFNISTIENLDVTFPSDRTNGNNSTSTSCVDGLAEDTLDFYECRPNCSADDALCFNKCCAENQLMSVTETKIGCVEAEDFKWSPTIYNNVRNVAVNSNIKFHWTHVSPRNLCTHGILYFQTPYLHHPKNLFRILKDGRVIHKERSHWLDIPKGSYCLEGIFPQQENGSMQMTKVDDLVYRCFESMVEEHIHDGFTDSSVYKLGMIVGCFISAFFVFLTILVYLLLWENQNIHGWTLLCSFLSLFSLYMHLGFMQGYHVIWGTDANIRNFPCWIIGVGLHFSYLSFFSWATVVNFDLWCTFRNLRTVNQHKRKWFRFLKYAIVGFGLPLSIISISVGFDYFYRMDELAEFVFPDPDYGSDKCFLARNESPVAYLLGPIGTLLTINIIFIVVTIGSVYKAQKTASLAVHSSSQPHKQSLKLFGKLLIVMGVLWVFDIISFVFSRDYVPWYFAIFDVINVCHGIFIFLIFVCKNSTLRSLETKYPTISRLSERLRKWRQQSRGCCSFFPDTLHNLVAGKMMYRNGQARSSTQSDHPTEMSTVV